MKTYVFTNRVYPPVGGATGELLKELAEGLVAGGDRVVVVTSRRGEETKRLKDEGTKSRAKRDSVRRSRGQTKGLQDYGTGRQEAGDRGQGAEGMRHTEEWPQRGARGHGDESGQGKGGRGRALQLEELTLRPGSLTGWKWGRRDEEDLRLKTPTGVEVIRVGTATFTRASHWRRALSYLTLYPQLMWQVWKLGKVDAVVSMTDPPLQVAAVTLASCRARKKIHWAQDVYPELAEELGVIVRGGLFAGVLRAVSTLALRCQDEIVVVGRCMRERLMARGIDAGKIKVIPNWSPVAAVSADVAASMRRKLGWGEEFVALYSGNIGLAHDFETLVAAAKLLAGSGVRMVFAGEGPRLEEVKRATAGLAQVDFLPAQPKEELGAFLAAADVHLVTVRAGLEGLVVPSKAYGILAAGRPVMYVGPAESEIAQWLSESGAGRVFPNGDARGLAEALTELSAGPARGRMMGERALKLSGQFTAGKAAERWQAVLDA